MRRGDLLRPQFAQWDGFDPVSHAFLDLREAQSELYFAFADEVEAALSRASKDRQFQEAIKKRQAAGEKLTQALTDRESWPDPKLGLRD